VNARLAALDFITGCLSVQSSSDRNATLSSVIAAGRLDWPSVITIANAQLVTPALWVSLRNRGLVEHMPSAVGEYLRELHRLNTLRNEHLRAQAIEVVSRLNTIGIEPVLLKGSALLFVDTFDDPGSRVMADLDLLVPPESAKQGWHILRRTLGYVPVDHNAERVHAGLGYLNYVRHHHLRPLHRPGEYGVVEIHREVLPSETGRLLPASLVWSHVEPVQEGGVRMGVPVPTYRILHNLLHSDLVNRTYIRGDISLRSLHELALTQTVCHERIDWSRIRQLMDRGGALKVLDATLYLCHRLLGTPLPDRRRPTLKAKVHYARSRLQVRWGWTEEVIDRLLWFSAQDLGERYDCDNSLMALTRARLQLAAYLSCKYSRYAFRWAWHRLYSG
jgi:hypothetical protein